MDGAANEASGIYFFLGLFLYMAEKDSSNIEESI